MHLKDIGEFGVVERLVRRLSFPKKPSKNFALEVAIGDDAAIFAVPGKTNFVVTKDMFVENVHFRRGWSDFSDIGWKSMEANISDLAAMGGADPLVSVVGLALPVDISVDNVDKLYDGMDKSCRRHGVIIVGGDTVLSKKDIIISITLIGKIEKKRIVRRDGARIGDLLCVTGTFGDSYAGMDVLKRKLSRKKYGQLVHKHLRPEARIRDAKIISSGALATSLTDSSDGLAASVTLLAVASDVSADVFMDKIPVSENFRRWSREFRKFPWTAVCDGGEEYELVFTSPASKKKSIADVGATIIGEMKEGKGVEWYLNGKKTNYIFRGYQNF